MPYDVRVAIDLKLNVGLWYSVKGQGYEAPIILPRPDLVDRPVFEILLISNILYDKYKTFLIKLLIIMLFLNNSFKIHKFIILLFNLIIIFNFNIFNFI